MKRDWLALLGTWVFLAILLSGFAVILGFAGYGLFVLGRFVWQVAPWWVYGALGVCAAVAAPVAWRLEREDSEWKERQRRL